MAQEFASDNSKRSIFARLNLSNHRGFFSFLFVSLSLILLLVTFAAVQQQQTTQSKAAGAVNICNNFRAVCPVVSDHIDFDSYCTTGIGFPSVVHNPTREVCCQVQTISGKKQCTVRDRDCVGLNYGQCTGVSIFSPLCEWQPSEPGLSGLELLVRGKCVNKGTTNPPPAGGTIDFVCGAKEGEQFDVLKEAKCCVSPLFPKLNSGSQTRVTCTQPKLLGRGALCDPNSTIEICNPLKKIRCEKVTIGGNETGICRDILGGTVVCDSCTAAGQGCSVTGSIPCEGFKCTPTSSGSTVGKCERTTTQPPGPDGGRGGDTACTSISGRCLTGQTGREGKDCKNQPGVAKSGKIQSGLCTGAPDRQCCVPNSTSTKVTCTAITTQEACLPPDQCVWITKRGTTDTKTCQRACGRIPDQPTCDKRADCNWKNNACTTKKGGGDGGTTGNIDLNLKLSYQGIVTLPKTKTELKVRVKLIDAVNKEKIKDAVQFTADSNGIWSGKASFKDVDLNQKYYLLIKGPMHLQKKICKADAADPQPGYYSCQFGNITLQSGSNDFDYSNVKLLVGDLDHNGVVDSADTSVVFNDLLLPTDQRQSADVLERSDLNLDGIVSTQDWSLVLEALKIKYDEK